MAHFMLCYCHATVLSLSGSFLAAYSSLPACLLFLLLYSAFAVPCLLCCLVCFHLLFCVTPCKMKKQSLSSKCKCGMLLWMWKSLESKN